MVSPNNPINRRRSSDRVSRIALLFIIGAIFYAFLASSAHSAISYVKNIGTANAKSAGTTLSVTVPGGGVTAGNSIIVTFAMDADLGVTSCSDTAGNTYTRDRSITRIGDVTTVIFSSHNVSALSSGDNITVTHPSVTARAMSVSEFSGLASTSTLDQLAADTGSGTSPSSGATPITTVANELLIGAIGVEGRISDSFTKGVLWDAALPRDGTIGNPAHGNITINPEYWIVSATGSYTADGTITNRDWAAAIATYKEAPPVVTVAASGIQTASMNIPSTDQYLGGAFTFITDQGSVELSQIVLSETNTVDAGANISIIKLYYETTDTCNYDGNETLFGTAANFNGSEQSTISSFASDTITYNSGGTQIDFASDIAKDDSGNIYVAGEIATNNKDWAIRKYDALGNLDTSWGSGGTVTYNSGPDQYDMCDAITIDSSNSIYVAGSILSGSIRRWAVRKYDANGDLDTTWGDGDSGTVTYGVGGTSDYARAITIDASNNIYVAGYQGTNGTDWAIRKYDANGDLDTTWGDGDSGMVTYNSGGTQDDYAYAMVIDSANNIYVAGAQGTNGTDWAIRKYDANGDLDTTWGDADSGMVNYTSAGAEYDVASAIAIDTANNIYVAGRLSLFTTAWGIRKYDSNGDLDTSWGDSDSGMITYDTARNEYVNDITVDASNNIYVSGFQDTASNDDDWLTIKYDAYGDLVTTWGNSGMVTYNSGGTQTDHAAAVILDSSNNLYVTGSQQTNGYDWAIRKYDVNGDLFQPMTVGISQVCTYVVLDVGPGANDGDLLDIEIADPSSDVTADYGIVSPGTAVAISGTTTLNLPTCQVITTADSGAGSLRECINYANSNPGTTISFNIPGPGNQSSGTDSWWRISPTAIEGALPTIITSGTVIDGTTQTTNQDDTNTKGPEIELEGSNVSGAIGLSITASSCVVRGLVINSFDSSGIRISGGSGTTIAGNYIGTNATGDAEAANYEGIQITNSTDNLIGGTSDAERNVISGNQWRGVLVNESAAPDNVIWGNYIGTNATGTGALAGQNIGIYIWNSPNNDIGSTAADTGNVISGNTQYGIYIWGANASGNSIYGNTIGLAATGSTEIGNGSDASNAGVAIMSAPDNFIGNTTTGAANVIAGNTGKGIYISGVDADNNIILGNSIYNNSALGIDLAPDGVGASGGANNDKTAPTINSISTSGSDFIITATAESGDIIQFYRANNAGTPFVDTDDSAFGEGYLYLGRCVDNGACSGDYISNGTDDNPANGMVQATILSTGLSLTDNVSATATDGARNTSEFGAILPATAVTLVSFTAQGDGNAIKVAWQTAREFDNLGFHLYRATSPAGPYKRLTDKLISATIKPGKGGSYSFVDTDVTVGTLYYYKLEDIDIYSKHTQHGPICVDWDADGIPDDWEITHGLNPWVNDADMDYDGDGLSNLEEYERGLDPFNPDSDGDGIPDGEEDGRLSARDDPGSRAISRGVEVLAKDDSGMTLVLNTSGFEAEVVSVGGQEYERLSIADYVHGYTAQTGAPQLPLKGLLIDVPEGKAAQLSVVDRQVEPYNGYRVYPVPEAVLDAAGGMAAVGSAFYQDELAYGTDGFYPQSVAALGPSYVFRDQVKQQVIFYPLDFNPASGQLHLYRRIELRIDFVDTLYGQTGPQKQMPWQVSGNPPGVLAPIAVGLAASPTLFNPLHPLLSSLGAAITALWSPPEDADGNVYKVITELEGIHQIGKEYLDTKGVDTGAIRLSQIRVYYLGQEVAIEVFDQNSDDRMDAQDYIRFYAQPVNATYAKYSDQNVYWLTLSGGTGAPMRMAGIEAAPTGGQLAADFADTAHHEKDQVIWIKAPGNDSIERWFFWTYVQGTEHPGGGQPKAFTINVPDPTSSGTLTILMAGQTNTDHEIKVTINGVQQSFSWNGIKYYQSTVYNVPLEDGDNTVTLQCLSADGNDSIIVDWFKVDYRRDYVAIGNTSTFSPDSGDRYVIDGFTSNSLLAYDISNPAAVAKIDNAVITGANPYSIDFEPTVYGDTYLVLTADTVNTPVGLIQDTADTLAESTNSADYILITHRDVGWDGNGDQLPWLADLIAHREAQGLRVLVADIEDIYDSFSYGVQSPHAVKDFLAFAYTNWTAPAARYVLLVGDSTYDPKNHWNENDNTAYLPTYMIYTDYKGETVTDQWFVTFSGDDAIADMHIGRLPAADAVQAEQMVAKIIAYESAVNTQIWQNDLLLIADNQRTGDAYAYEAAFEAINDQVADLVPEAMADPFKGYLNDYAASAFLTDDIIDSINDGVLIANYAGHGATQVLAEEHIFDAGDVAALTNADRLSFFVSMACEAGFFAYPETWFYPSLAEVLLRSDAGAVAALMPTGMTTTDGQQILDAALFEALFNKDIRTLGPAIAEAKQTLLANGDDYYEQIADTFLLFGDPATKLKVPLPHIPTWIDARRQDVGAQLRWNAVFDCNGGAVAGYNLYRAKSAAGPFNKINPQLITDTVFVDTDISVSMAAAAGGSSYYKVSSVDETGFESAQSLSISPSALNSFSGSSGSGAGKGCFIGSTTSYYISNEKTDKYLPLVIRCIGFLLIICLALSFVNSFNRQLKKYPL